MVEKCEKIEKHEKRPRSFTRMLSLAKQLAMFQPAFQAPRKVSTPVIQQRFMHSASSICCDLLLTFAFAAYRSEHLV
jgi:hypothetical protein